MWYSQLKIIVYYFILDEGCSDESSRRERTSRRGHWESEHESTEKSRKIIPGSRNYTDRQDLPSRFIIS